jgi:NADH-quinone oxidoreductase subunit G
VRFSQEIAEDHQLVLQERGAHSYVATFDGHPYVAPFSGNIIELCPVGALTSQPYRFRARPWDIEQSGSVCTLCPAQCNVSFTVRDDRVLRVLARDNPEVDDGWLCDKGRFAYQAVHADERVTQPLLRDGGVLRPVPWERALAEAAAALGRARGRAAGLAGDGATNEEGFLLQRLVREALGSADLDSRVGGDGVSLPAELHRALAAPALQATVADLEFADAVLVLDTEPVDDAPILDLRLRKGVRRHGVRLAVASARPSSLDANADASLRFAPGAGEALLLALDAAAGGPGDLDGLASAAGVAADQLRALAAVLHAGGSDLVVLAGERLLSGARGPQAARALLNVLGRLGLTEGRPGAGLLVVPSAANGRGLAEAGVLPGAGPGLADAPAGRPAAQIAQAAAGGELAALYLLRVDPLRDLPGRAAWAAALEQATTVVAHASFLTEGLAEHATVVFPAEAYAEKDGTVTHPDGRLQRLRPAIGHPGDVRAEWRVLADVLRRLGVDTGGLTGEGTDGAAVGLATRQLAAAVPHLAGLTLDEIGAQGLRWQEREAAAAFPDVDLGPFALAAPPAGAPANGRLRLGTFRSIWASREVAESPALAFLHPRQRAELSPADAARLGVGQGDRVVVAADGHGVAATVALRAATPEGTVFLETGVPEGSATELDGPLVEVRRAP